MSPSRGRHTGLAFFKICIITSLLSVFVLGAEEEIQEPRFAHRLFNLQGPKPLNSDTHDDVLDKQGCKALTVLFAADAQEPGNVGMKTGPQFFKSLALIAGGRDQLSLQGIDYPVDYFQYDEGWEYWERRDTEGPELMASLAAKVMEECPLTHLVLAGYGQGAQLVHDAATQMQRQILDFVRAVVIFGEASHTKRLGNPASRIKKLCSQSDAFCPGQEAIGKSRLTYTKDSEKAARFVLNRIISRR